MSVNYDKKAKYKLLDEVGFRRHFKAGTWAEFNRQFFDGLAPKYDRLNEVLSLGQHHRIKESAIRKAEIRPGQRILDLCTGSGDIAVWIAKNYPECTVLGGDVSERMLEIAARRGEGLRNLTFQTLDCMNLALENESFDVVIVSFGLRNLDDLKTGLLEMKRVSRKGGKIINLDLGCPQNFILKAVHELYFRKFIPFFGEAYISSRRIQFFRVFAQLRQIFSRSARVGEDFSGAGV